MALALCFVTFTALKIILCLPGLTNNLPNSNAKAQHSWQDLILEGFSFPLASLSAQWDSFVLVLESPKQVLWLPKEQAAFSGQPHLALVPLLQLWHPCVLWKLSGPLKSEFCLLQDHKNLWMWSRMVNSSWLRVGVRNYSQQQEKGRKEMKGKKWSSTGMSTALDLLDTFLWMGNAGNSWEKPNSCPFLEGKVPVVSTAKLQRWFESFNRKV